MPTIDIRLSSHRLRVRFVAGIAATLTLIALSPGCISPNPVPTSEKPAATGGSGGTTISLPASGKSGSGGSGAGTARPECLASAECSPPRPYCVPDPGRCVECLSHANCSGTGKRFCQPIQNVCVLCLSDAHCTATEPYCSPEGNCVQCLTSRNCGTRNVACDAVLHRCVATCASDEDCSVDVGRPFCNADLSECVQCVADEDCPPIRAHCLLSVGTCEKCLADSDCASPTPRCDGKSHVCAECVSNADCRTGYACEIGVCTIIPE